MASRTGLPKAALAGEITNAQGNAKLNKGDRVRFVIKQIPDKLLIVKIEKA